MSFVCMSECHTKISKSHILKLIYELKINVKGSENLKPNVTTDLWH